MTKSGVSSVCSQLMKCHAVLELFASSSREIIKTISDIMSELKPEQTVARMRFTELQHLLERCQETANTAKKQFGKFAGIATGKLAREARKQMRNGSLEGKLVETLAEHARSRLKDINATKRRFDSLGAAEAVNAVKAETESLVKQAQTKSNGKFCLQVAGVVAVVAFVAVGGSCIAVAGSISTQIAIAVFTGILTVGGIAVTAYLSDKIDNLVRQLEMLAKNFEDIHGSLSRVCTDVDKLLEKTKTAEGDIDLMRSLSSAAQNRYESLGREDVVTSFLDELEQLAKETGCNESSATINNAAVPRNENPSVIVWAVIILFLAVVCLWLFK
ncbi:uncharacterized protein LOC134197955 [Corticium candelabrum]|uniref:uncharacterized protein LOC134197955 n=1 Tax=Corticium candelabrum TaxID=121492 RepID=UPI002E261E2B|nr:uncharacterized protein LOC134197955 [Corticium candelabrum]XP_062523291.1 uncharacterized protein LOC134197955 [Corticium candelabrum]XP_062523292.1 uncharacterized protein LOC134197955 [Corticium candelabrum]